MDQRDFEQKYRPFSPTEIPLIGGGKIVSSGISVREYIATHILTGILCSEEGSTLDDCVECAIKATDILQQKLSDQLSKDIRETDFKPPYNPYPIKNDSK